MIKEFWGRGLGTEAAIGWMDFGFETKGLERIVEVANVDNTASRRLMEKIGMQYEKTEPHYEIDCAFYAISKTDFRANNPL